MLKKALIWYSTIIPRMHVSDGTIFRSKDKKS